MPKSAPAVASAGNPASAPVAKPTPMNTVLSASSAAARKPRVLVLGSGDAGAHAAALIDQLGMEAAIIDSPSIERLDAVRNCGYAVVATTKEVGEQMLLAVGFMLALLGRSRIAVVADDVPAALTGCVTVPFDEGGLWRLLLAREMKKAGLEIDLNRAL
jgi:threonine dehydrogenase-like Zn-dependent dehydrogenase